MKRLILVILALVVFASISVAANKVFLPDNYPIGYTFQGYVKHADGWHFQKGIYDLVEYKEWVYGRWQLYYDFKYKSAIAETPPEDWRNQFVKALRDKAEAQAFERSMQALGLQYGNSAYYQYRSISTYPTEYRREAIDLITPLNQDVFMQQSFKLLEGMQLLQSQAFSERKELVGQALQVQALRELNNGYERILKSQQVPTVRQEIQVPATDNRQVLKAVPPDLLALSIKYQCVECHKKEQVKWTPQSHMTLDTAGVNEVVERLVTKGKGHMPKGGPHLPVDEVVKFLIQ